MESRVSKKLDDGEEFSLLAKGSLPSTRIVFKPMICRFTHRTSVLLFVVRERYVVITICHCKIVHTPSSKMKRTIMLTLYHTSVYRNCNPLSLYIFTLEKLMDIIFLLLTKKKKNRHHNYESIRRSFNKIEQTIERTKRK